MADLDRHSSHRVGRGLTVVAVASAAADGFWGIFGAVTAAFVVENALDLALTLVAPAIRGTGDWRDTAGSIAPALLGSLPIQAPLMAVLAYSYVTISPWSVALFAIPAVAAQGLFSFTGSNGRRQKRSVVQMRG